MYDLYGNMTDRSVTDGLTTPPANVPSGLHFTGRTHADNRIADAGYAYDENGNLLAAPDWSSESGGTWLYRFTPENRIAMIQAAGSGKVKQHARFDASGHRWAREGASDGGKGHVSLRDASGQVVAEYVESSADSGLELTKEYVRGGPGLLAEYSTCGPRPALALALALNSPYEAGPNVNLIKTDVVPASGDYTILIEAADGRQKTLSRPPSLADQFTIPISDFYSGVDNFVRLQTDAACGITGYGNAVSYHREATTGCLQTMTSYRSQLGDGDEVSHLHIATSASGCPGGTLFNMYFEREGTTQPVSLNPNPVPITQVILPNLPAGASHGRYWVAAVNPQTGVEFKNSPAVNDGLHSTGADTGSEPGEASRNLRFAHLDHLGSTRVISDEAGEVVARLKFYPFGMEAEPNEGDATQMKFTGHERDDDVHVDYMLARFYAAGLGRFISTDPLADSAVPVVSGSWNRYAYVQNSPMVFIDPTGLCTVDPESGPGGDCVTGIVVDHSDATVTVEYGDGTEESHTAAVGDPESSSATEEAEGTVTGTAWGPVSDRYENTQESYNEDTNPNNPYGPAIILVEGTDGRHVHGTTGPINDDTAALGGDSPADRQFTNGCARVCNTTIIDLKGQVDRTLAEQVPIKVRFQE